MKKKSFLNSKILDIIKKIFILKLFSSLVQKSLPIIDLLYFNWILKILESRNITYITIILTSCFLFLLNIILITLNFRINELLVNNNSLKLKDRVFNYIIDEISSLKLQNFENSEFYDTLNIITQQCDIKIMSLIDSVVSFISSFLSAGTLITILIMLDPLIIFFVLFDVVFSIIFNIVSGKINFERYKESINSNRKLFYIQQLLSEIKSIIEIKLNLNLNNLLKLKKEQQIENLVDINKKYYKKNKKVNFFQQSTTIFFNYIYTLYLVYNILSYKIGISNFVTSMTGVNQLKYNLIGISQIIPSLIENIRYIKKMREILIMPKDNLDCGKSIDKIEQIEFKNVSFKYPNTDRYILKDISFNMYKGQTIALVGKNGIGKSTIIKLLCGLYSIDEGELLLNNVNIKNYNIDDIRKQIGVVFQSPKLFSFSILENILLTNNISKEDIERVNKELVRFDLNNKIDTLENGIYTNLSREFSNAGTFLSGGEYQKISILRSKIKKGSLYIFDEPTSSLDPITEKEIMRIITSELSESIKIFVTHRLSNLINFDKIYVLNKGRIIEFGTHEELMVRKGFYYEMYKAQNKFNED